MERRGETKKPSFTESVTNELKELGFVDFLAQNTGYDLEKMNYSQAEINAMEKSIKKRLGIAHSAISDKASIKDYAKVGADIVSELLG